LSYELNGKGGEESPLRVKKFGQDNRQEGELFFIMLKNKVLLYFMRTE